MAPWAGGAMGRQPLPGSQDENQQAASAGVKAKAKKAADLWRAKEGANVFIARGGFNMPEEIKRQRLLLVLDKVEDVSGAVTKQLRQCPNSL